jgi:hypothetical protein
MTDEEIIAKILANEWWPFDQVDPKILEEIQRRDKQQEINGFEEALL